LDIQIIAASSPQAKGRIEQNHGTHQDRLVKKLRRLGIADAAAANAFLDATYLPGHNRRFAVAPASTEHRCLQTHRTISTSSHRRSRAFTRGHLYFAKNGDISISR
jgi:hypothetical protein